MAFIVDKFTDTINKDINPQKIWSHLETMYNLEALDESESIPFPNTEKDFVLPESDFGNLLTKKDEDKTSKTQPQKGRETPKNMKEIKKEDKATPIKKEAQRRDSKDSKDSKTPVAKKELKKEPEKTKPAVKGRNSVSTPKDDAKSGKNKSDETPKQTKRPTRGSLKPNDDSGSSGKSSPITVTPTVKRRRI